MAWNYFEKIPKQPRRMPYDYLGQIRSDKAPMEANRDYCTICFPPHPRLYTKFFRGPDGFRERKKDLLRGKWDVKWTIDECVVFVIPVTQLPFVRQIVMDQILPSARIWFLNEVEFYFAQDHDTGPFSPINELESLSTILFALRSLISISGCDGQVWFQPLEKEVFHMIETLARINDSIYNMDDTLHKEASDPSSYEMVNWAAANNIKRKLMIAHVQEYGGKGLVAMEDIGIGDVVLEIPLDLVISNDDEDDDYDHFFGRALRHSKYEEFPVNGKMLSWLIDERSKVDSKFGVYFKTLPEEFKLGLFFSDDAELATHGTQLRSGINTANWDAEKLFDKLRLLNPRASLEDFNWAYGLWFSHGINAILPNGMRRRCLVPFAGFFNHSLFPHVLHCEWGTESLKFTASRPCRKGAQCYLSYGNLSGPELVLYYGFLPKGINYSDAIKIEPDFCDPRYEYVEVESPWRFYLARGPVQKGGDTHLPSQLLDHHRSFLIATDEVLKHCALSLQNEISMLSLRRIFSDRLQMLNFYREKLRKKPEVLFNWDVKLALEYQELERAILESVNDGCDPWDYDRIDRDACDPLEDDIMEDDIMDDD